MNIMNKDIKQMIVMLVSVAFIATLAIVVLSSSAAAQATHPDRIDEMLQHAEDHLSDEKPNIHYTFSDERMPTQSRPAFFDDEPVVHDYDSDRARIEQLEGDIQTLQDTQMNADNGHDTDFTGNVIALILILIVAVVFYGAIKASDEKAASKRYNRDISQPHGRCLTGEEQNELSVYMDSDEYKQTSNKDMALAYKIDQIVANRSQQADTGYYDENTGIYHSEPITHDKE